MTRIVCPHCGEYERHALQSVTDLVAVYYCKACLRWSQWVRETPTSDWQLSK